MKLGSFRHMILSVALVASAYATSTVIGPANGHNDSSLNPFEQTNGNLADQLVLSGDQLMETLGSAGSDVENAETQYHNRSAVAAYDVVARSWSSLASVEPEAKPRTVPVPVTGADLNSRRTIAKAHRP